MGEPETTMGCGGPSNTARRAATPHPGSRRLASKVNAGRDHPVEVEGDEDGEGQSKGEATDEDA